MYTNDPLVNFEQNFQEIAQTYTVTQIQAEDEGPIREKASQIVQKYAMIENITFDFALIGICGLLQSGAYLKSVTNRKIKINNKEFTKRSLLFASEQVDNKYTLRKIARSIKYIIAQIAVYYGIPGHLFARYRLENANIVAQIPKEQIILFSAYCTDFQIENVNTPQTIREYLANREKNRTYKKN